MLKILGTILKVLLNPVLLFSSQRDAPPPGNNKARDMSVVGPVGSVKATIKLDNVMDDVASFLK